MHVSQYLNPCSPIGCTPRSNVAPSRQTAQVKKRGHSQNGRMDPACTGETCTRDKKRKRFDKKKNCDNNEQQKTGLVDDAQKSPFTRGGKRYQVPLPLVRGNARNKTATCRLPHQAHAARTPRTHARLTSPSGGGARALEGFGGIIPGSVMAVIQRFDIANSHRNNPTHARIGPPRIGNLCDIPHRQLEQ